MENLKVFARLRQTPRKRLEEVIEFTGLGYALKKTAGSYSMGMKQRLALAVAIMPKPTFLILDEPFNGLDPEGVFELRGMIKKLAQEGCGILFSSHQLLEMEKISSRNLFIKGGKIVSEEEAQSDVAVLTYRLYIDCTEQDLSMLGKLKTEGLLQDFQLEEQEISITLTDVKHSTKVITTILADGRELRGIVPQTANIENLYSHIYGKEVL